MKQASFAALGTTATVVVEHASDLREAHSLLQQELRRIDVACSRFRNDSDLARANASSGRRVQVGALFAESLGVAIDAARITEGAVVPTMGAGLASAGYDRTFRLVQARGAWTVRTVEAKIDAWQQIELDLDAQTVRIPPGVQLDLGAVAKALAADRAAAAIAAAVCPTLVSLGGDIAVAGEAPAGGWVVRIAEDHAAPSWSRGPTVVLSVGGLATSSTTVRRWATDRGSAHHVLDPATGWSAATPWRTVSAAAASCVDANVAALAAIVLGRRARGWLVRRGVHARLVARDGTVSFTGAWPAEAEAA